MKTRLTLSVLGLAALSATLAFAQSPQDSKQAPAASKPPAAKPAQQTPPEMQLPPGMTPEMMQACADAATPGEQHAYLASFVGRWNGKQTMWMTPEAEPMETACVAVITPVMDNRFIKVEINGDMPGMGPYHGFGMNGYDNASGKYQCTWVDNCSTAMMSGIGERSSEGNAMEWKLGYTCPITKQPKIMREVETRTGKDSYTLEIFMEDFSAGKEYRMSKIEFTRASDIDPATGVAR